MLLDLFSDPAPGPAECVVSLGDEELGDAYPLLTEVTVEASRQQAAEARLVFDLRRDEGGRFAVLDDGLTAPWRSVRVEADFGSSAQEVFRGWIRQERSQFPTNPANATLTVECQDDSMLLDRGHQRRTWGGDAPTTDSTLLAEVLSDAGLSPHPDNGAGQQALVLNQDSTDIQLLQRRAEANAYELLFAEGRVYFGPSRLELEPQPTILVYAGPESHCYEISIDGDGQRADGVGFDAAAETGAEAVSEEVTSDLPPLGPEPASSEGDGGLSPYVWRLRSPGTSSPERLRAMAQRRANEEALARVVAEGELDGSLYGHVLRPGEPVGIDGVGETHSGIWYVDSVTHTFNHSGYRQRFRLLRNARGDNLESGGGPLAALL
ncbi:MAG: hypothetical protein AAGD01_10840 [Acidobacteriota bacterium]